MNPSVRSLVLLVAGLFVPLSFQTLHSNGDEISITDKQKAVIHFASGGVQQGTLHSLNSKEVVFQPVRQEVQKYDAKKIKMIRTDDAVFFYNATKACFETKTAAKDKKAEMPPVVAAPAGGQSWEERVGKFDDDKKLGPLEPGSFILIVRNGKAFYVPLDKLKDTNTSPESVFGLNDTARPLTAVEQQLLSSGMLFNSDYGSRRTIDAKECAELRTAQGIIYAQFIRISDGRLLYLGQADVIKTQPLPRGKKAPIVTDAREIPLSDLKQILLPPTKLKLNRSDPFLGCRQDALAYDADKKRLFFLRLMRLDERPLVSTLVARFDTMRTSCPLPLQPLHVATSSGPFLCDIGPQGEVTYRRDGNSPTRSPVQIQVCPGSVTRVILDEEGVYKFDHRRQAFVHESGSSIPITGSSLETVAADRLKMYQELTRLFLIPKSSKCVPFADFNADDRVDFNNAFGGSWNDLMSRPVERQLNAVKSMNMKSQRLSLYSRLVTRYVRSADGKPASWETLDPEEQLAVHRHFEIHFRNVEATAKRVEAAKKAAAENEERFWDGLGTVIGAYVVLRNAAEARAQRIYEEAMKRDYEKGDPVRSFLPPILGGWYGRIWNKLNDRQYEIRIDLCIMSPSLRKERRIAFSREIFAHSNSGEWQARLLQF